VFRRNHPEDRAQRKSIDRRRHAWDERIPPSRIRSTTEGILRQTDIPVLVVRGVSALHSLDDRREIRNIRAVMAPIDFGPLSGRDARIAAGIAESIGIPLLLAHVTMPIGCQLERGVGPAGLDQDTARARLSALRAELPPGSDTRILVSSGRPAEEIAALAAANDVGLIVMGLCGAGGSEGPGSIAYDTVCLAPTMLLVLPPLLRRAAAGTRLKRTDMARMAPADTIQDVIGGGDDESPR
jgi:nucleotide-binding universal stress UspA family protein